MVRSLRILLAGGGALVLTMKGLIDPRLGLAALVAIAIPTHIGAVIELVGRVIPSVGKKP